MKVSVSVVVTAILTGSPLVYAQQLSTGLDIRYSTLVSDSFIKRGVNKTADYTNAVLYRGIEQAYIATQNQTYIDWIKSQIDGVVAENGSIAGYPKFRFSLDDVRIGTIILDLLTTAPATTRYRIAADTLRSQLNRNPRTPSGGFWHRDPTYPNQMWLDGIYMADVFYAQYTSLFEPTNTTAWDDIILQYSLVERYCRNTTSNLLAHGYDESKRAVWADPVTGASPIVWDRALGWYMMALVDVLDFFPTDHPGHAQLLDWFTSASTGVLDAQDEETGGWWLVMNEPYPGMEKNYIESSATAMFIYSIFKGVRLQYLDSEKYLAPMKKAYEYTAKTFVAFNGTEGTVNWEGTVLVGSLSSNASYEYYTSVPVAENDYKGVGPFIMASVEYERVCQQETQEKR